MPVEFFYHNVWNPPTYKLGLLVLTKTQTEGFIHQQS